MQNRTGGAGGPPLLHLTRVDRPPSRESIPRPRPFPSPSQRRTKVTADSNGGEGLFPVSLEVPLRLKVRPAAVSKIPHGEKSRRSLLLSNANQTLSTMVREQCGHNSRERKRRSEIPSYPDLNRRGPTRVNPRLGRARDDGRWKMVNELNFHYLVLGSAGLTVRQKQRADREGAARLSPGGPRTATEPPGERRREEK
ncbi:hypothetical protein THAOC_24330 [Thalassiosira oceanica]|uniref:Uncharacterized protein n=1 Tax=Thalassiosira oceanica TaxID=159749 RepID=K0RU10_THAOC|nr:hypothetical protein THAOC_24330 [Thalassiosira oceanica]|eukprot:EJK55879.1 hypothetical protein THAOC_24330 [Thalassiosira oceanica]